MSDAAAARPSLRLRYPWPRRPARAEGPRHPARQLTPEERAVLATLLRPGERIEKVLRTGNAYAWRSWAATTTRVLMLERTPRAFHNEDVPWWGMRAIEVEPDGELAVVRLWALGRRYTLYGTRLAEARVFESAVRLRLDAPAAAQAAS